MTRTADLVEALACDDSVRPRVGPSVAGAPGSCPASFVKTVPDRHAIELSLYHVHLPKLVESGFVEWGREASVVRLAASPPLSLDALLSS